MALFAFKGLSSGLSPNNLRFLPASCEITKEIISYRTQVVRQPTEYFDDLKSLITFTGNKAMAKAFTLKNGLILLSTEAPGGIYNSAQLKKVSALCDENTAIVKATEDQRLALFVKPENAAKVKKELQSVGLGVRNYQEGLHQPVNCIGNMCPENQQDALSTSMELQKTLSSLQLSSSLRIGINGCYRCCVPTHTLDISIIGDSGGYRISLGGKNSQIPEMACFMAENVPDADIPRLVKQIITIYQKHASEDESLQNVMDRVGSSEFIKALHPYSQDAAGADDAFGGFSSDSEMPSEGLDVEAASSDDETFEMASSDDLSETSSDDLSFDNLGTDSGDLSMSDDIGDIDVAGDMDMSDLSVDTGDTELSMTDEPSFTESGDEFASLESDPMLSEPAADLNGLDGDIAIAGDEIMEMSDDVSFASTDDLSLEDDLEAITPEVLADDIGDVSLEALEIEPEFESMDDNIDLTELKVEEELPLDESGNTLEADEVDESEADAFEEKLNASIEEEESMPMVEDENSESRMAAVRLVEASSADDEDVSASADAGFGNLEIERDTAEFDEEIDNIDLSPEVFDEAIETPVQIQPSAKTSGGNSLSGIDFIDGGRIAIRFENGAQVTFALSALSAARREISVGGKPIGIALNGNGVNIEVDGMSVFFPKAAA